MPLVRREVLRQVFAPLRVIAVRLMLYYLPRYKGFDRPWVSVRNAVARLREERKIIPVPVNGENWYRLPNVSRSKLDEVRDQKMAVNAAWTSCLGRAGFHAEHLWRKAFAAEGWVVPVKSVEIPCPSPDGTSHASTGLHEIDVFAFKRSDGLVACEVKNGPAEGWVDPEIPQPVRATDQQHRVTHHFEAMADLDLTPMLAAPFVDPSFYRFQARYEGVHAKYLYHVFPPDKRDIAAAVKETFRIGHVWAEPEPPASFGAFVRRLPAMIEKTREVRSRMDEAEEERSDMEDPDSDAYPPEDFYRDYP